MLENVMNENFSRERGLASIELDTGSSGYDIVHVLDGIDYEEEVPDRLLSLAIQLQESLVEQRRRRNPS